MSPSSLPPLKVVVVVVEEEEGGGSATYAETSLPTRGRVLVAQRTHHFILTSGRDGELRGEMSSRRHCNAGTLALNLAGRRAEAVVSSLNKLCEVAVGSAPSHVQSRGRPWPRCCSIF